MDYQLSTVFYATLKKHNKPHHKERIWVYVPYDQLSDKIGALSAYPPEKLSIIMLESSWKAARRPYHKQKLCLILSNMRNFAIEQAKRGVHVEYRMGNTSFGAMLAKFIASQLGSDQQLLVMRPAERELRADIAPLVRNGRIKVTKHEGWLSSKEDFEKATKGKTPWRMDRFYQHMRKRTGVLMEQGKPIGGKYSFDAENRKPWNGTPTAAIPPSFPTNTIKDEVVSLIETVFSHHPGTLAPDKVPSTQEDALYLWEWAKQSCMQSFGPYEDAMSTLSSNIFHTRVSALIHLHRLLPAALVREVEVLDIPLNSKEGFIRQVLGWREFVYQVHEKTDGFRLGQEVAPEPSDAGFERWKRTAWNTTTGVDGGSLINECSYETPIPPAFWGNESGLTCLDVVVKDVWKEGYAHHIPRLMVLANIATLLEIRPREITDWFWVAFYDAFDWVVEPNVLAMGTFASGGLMTTKPYVAGAGYINKMSNYCVECSFHPKKTCPITRLYWAYLARHQERFAGNFRMKMILSLLKKRSELLRKEDAQYFNTIKKQLLSGEKVTPKTFEEMKP